MQITKKILFWHSMNYRMMKVISKFEKIPHEKLNFFEFFGYNFITDGSRIFKLILPKTLARYFSQTNTWDSLVENNQDYISRVYYKEVKTPRIKIYLPKDAADRLESCGCRLPRTLNGSRTGFNRYFIAIKKYLAQLPSVL